MRRRRQQGGENGIGLGEEASESAARRGEGRRDPIDAIQRINAMDSINVMDSIDVIAITEREGFFFLSIHKASISDYNIILASYYHNFKISRWG